MFAPKWWISKNFDNPNNIIKFSGALRAPIEIINYRNFKCVCWNRKLLNFDNRNLFEIFEIQSCVISIIEIMTWSFQNRLMYPLKFTLIEIVSNMSLTKYMQILIFEIWKLLLQLRNWKFQNQISKIQISQYQIS